MIQMIRNRISAQTSRDRKKNYLRGLEQAKAKIAEDYSKLANEKSQLLLEIKKLRDSQANIISENERIKSSRKSTCDTCILSPSEQTLPQPTFMDKELEELSCSIASQIPECNKSLFKNAFTYATFISLVLLTNGNHQKNFTPEGNHLDHSRVPNGLYRYGKS